MKKLRINKTSRTNFLTYGMVILAYVIMQAMGSMGMISSTLKGQLVPICAYVVMALSLNLTVGILGELSLGHAGFMSAGAFAGAVASTALQATIPNPALRVAVAMLTGAVVAGIAGVIIGILAECACITELPEIDQVIGYGLLLAKETGFRDCCLCCLT